MTRSNQAEGFNLNHLKNDFERMWGKLWIPYAGRGGCSWTHVGKVVKGSYVADNRLSVNAGDSAEFHLPGLKR